MIDLFVTFTDPHGSEYHRPLMFNTDDFADAALEAAHLIVPPDRQAQGWRVTQIKEVHYGQQMRVRAVKLHRANPCWEPQP